MWAVLAALAFAPAAAVAREPAPRAHAVAPQRGARVPRLAQDLRFPQPVDDDAPPAQGTRGPLQIPGAGPVIQSTPVEELPLERGQSDRGQSGSPAASHYEPLAADECEQLAADAAPLANLLADEHDAIDRLFRAIPAEERRRFCKVNSLRHALVALAAADARNTQAGEALRAYFELMSAESKRKLVRDSLTEVAATSAKFDRLREQGIEAQPDPLERQRLELEERAIDLEVVIDGLNAKLHVLLGAQAEPDVRLWPSTKVQSPAVVNDVEAEVALGLDAHPQLNALRVLRCSLANETLPAIREALSELQTMLGTRPTIVPLKRTLAEQLFRRTPEAPAEIAADLCVRQRQLDAYLAEREAETAARIRQAAAEIDARTRQMELARNRARSWQERLTRLEAQAALTAATQADLLTARTSLLEARQDLFQRVLETHLALVKLRAAQGCLGE